MTIAEKLQNVKDCIADYQAKSNEIIEGLYPIMADAQREQMLSGENNEGGMIGTYTPFTVFMKSRKGQPTDRVTLFDTGAFQSSIFVRVSGTDIIFDASDSKRDELVEKYGEKIFGLMAERYGPVSREWKNRMSIWIKEKI